MNAINKELYKPLNEEFSTVLSKYGTHRVEFSCTTKGFYVWYYTDDKVIGNIPGYEKCKGSRRDPHFRVRTYEELVGLEYATHERFSNYLLSLDQVDDFVNKLRNILFIK